MEDYKTIIPENYYLLIDNNNNHHFFCINENSQIKISKKKININQFKDKNVNTFWDITADNNYIQIKSKDFFSVNESDDSNTDAIDEKLQGVSNKEIFQSEVNQKLSSEEILSMKENMVDKNELIKTILDNNSSMEKRTIFSKEKIIKKKTKKYKQLVWITNTSLFNIIETYFLEQPKVINYLRFDSISSILLNINFLPNTNTLIYEETNGVLTGAVLMRIQYKSRLISLFKKKIFLKGISLMNFCKDHKARLTYINYESMTKNSWINEASMNYYDNLILCIQNDEEILTVFNQLFIFLRNSGNFVIFSKDKEILVSVDKMLSQNKNAIDTKIIETIDREYQVLPLRTHPMMNHKGFSGYVLVGYKLKYNE